ncbi:MAG: TolC family protein [Bacteriovoracaceae bacterium]
MRIFPILCVFLSVGAVHSYTFDQAAKKIKKHPKIEMLMSQVKALEEEGAAKSSWGDPKFGITARNFPKETLTDDQSPMTGVEYSLSQTIPLSSKYGNIERSYKNLVKSGLYDVVHQKREMLSLLWGFAIKKRQFTEDLRIIQENHNWLGDMLKVTKRLYANGKVSQQAVLELQIRNSELEAQISNKRHILSHLEESLNYLAGDLPKTLQLKSVPWKKLEIELGKESDSNEVELALKEKIKASELSLKAQKLSYVPDVTLSVGYLKRDKDLEHGDFVSAGLSFSLPLSGQKYAQSDGAFARKLKAQNELKDYHLKRKSQLKSLEHEIFKMEDELKIINEKSLTFAESSREITSKSYGLGSASYIELTQAEIKLQNLKLRKSALEGRLASKKVEYLLLRGDKLHEE